MADERVMSIIEFIKNKYPNPDLSAFPDKFAVQIELTDIPGGVFYMEVLNGELFRYSNSRRKENCRSLH